MTEENNIVEVRHCAFKKVNFNDPLPEGDVVYRVLKGTPFDPTVASGSRNLGNARSAQFVGEGMRPEVAQEYDWYKEDREATKALIERLIVSGEGTYRYKGQQYRPARLNEPHTLVVTHNGVEHEPLEPSVNKNIHNRHYVLREVQQSEVEEKLTKTANDFISAIVEKVRSEI